MPRLRGESEEQFIARTTYNSGTRPYKVYTALLSQTGTNAPVATVLENTLGGDVVWTRNDVGSYVATSSISAFTTNKTTLLYSLSTDEYSNDIKCLLFSTDSITVYSLFENATSDNVLNLSTIEIRVYI